MKYRIVIKHPRGLGSPRYFNDGQTYTHEQAKKIVQTINSSHDQNELWEFGVSSWVADWELVR